LVRGVYVDPKAGNVTFRAYSQDWSEVQPHQDSTKASVQQDLKLM
jgi:hypothetical protein